MSEPADLKEKLEDAREIALDLVHDLSGNPVSSCEELCLMQVSAALALIRSALGKIAEAMERWPEVE